MPRTLGDDTPWTWAGYVVLVAILALSPNAGGVFAAALPSATGLFWLVVLGASGCVVAAGALLVVAHRRGCAEQGLLGSLLWAVSVLPLAHGLTIPGVLVTENGGTWAAALLALPLGALASLPLVAPHSALARAVARRWQAWALGHILLVSSVAVAVVIDPHGWPLVDSGAWGTKLLACSGIIAMLALARRHFRLYRLGRHPASLLASIGFVNLAASGLVWFAPVAYTPGWWAVHLLDVTGVFLSIFALLALTPRAGVRRLLEPVVNTDPLVALELGLSPVVRAFVAQIADKDTSTHDHVTRAAELAMRLGLRADLSVPELRTIGLAALLHDVGKVGVPDEVLTKPGSLSDAEYDTIKTHSHIGWTMLQDEPLLRDVAVLVRGHHERFDGRGYPDGLAGSDLSLAQGLISVVDAFDAMTHNRHYRDGMSTTQAIEVLNIQSGIQFHPEAVTLLVAHLEESGGDGVVGVFNDAASDGSPRPLADACHV